MKKALSAVLAVLLLFTLTACSQEVAESPGNAGDGKTSIDELSLQDSETIYQDDDEDSIVTMYLTVSQGNAADNTNHT